MERNYEPIKDYIEASVIDMSHTILESCYPSIYPYSTVSIHVMPYL